jgi:hypothetical protein
MKLKQQKSKHEAKSSIKNWHCQYIKMHGAWRLPAADRQKAQRQFIKIKVFSFLVNL